MNHRQPATALVGACAAFLLLAAASDVRAQAKAATQGSVEEVAAVDESAAAAVEETAGGAATEEAAPPEAELTPEEQHYRDVLTSLRWVPGPTEVKVGSKATLRVPEGYTFLNAQDTKKFQELNQNIGGNDEYMLAPEDLHWFALFEYDNAGYVKDDEEIDADAILSSMKEGNEAANEERRKRGWEELHITGWRVKPAYNPDTKRLEWAIDARSDSGASTNLFTKILGRHGVTSVTLVTSPDTLEADAPKFREAIEGFEYVAGERYAEFREGDKIAEYGLAGLIAGGGVAVAAKSGLLKGLWKFLAAGAVALAAGLRKLFGGKSKDA